MIKNVVSLHHYSKIDKMKTLIRVKDTQSVIAKSNDNHSCQMIFNNLTSKNKMTKNQLDILLRSFYLKKGIEIELVVDDIIINSKIIK